MTPPQLRASSARDERRHASRGRALLAPWLVASVGIVLSFTLVRTWRHGPPGWVADLLSLGARGAAEPAREDGYVPVTGWSGRATLASGGVLSATVLPFHAQETMQGFRSRRLREELGLDPGTLFRVVLRLEEPEAGPPSASESVRLDGLAAEDGAGPCLTDLAHLREPAPGAAEHPFLNLLARSAVELAPGEGVQVAAWGRAPGTDARLVVQVPGGAVTLPLERTPFAAGSLPRSFDRPLDRRGYGVLGPATEAARGGDATSGPGGPPDDAVHRGSRDETPSEDEPPAERGGADEAWGRVDELERELDAARARVARLEERALEREEAFLRFQELVALHDLGTPPAAGAPAPIPEPAAEPAPVDLEAARAARRAEEVARALRALFRLEGLFALDLLEVGSLRSLEHPDDPEAHGAGPVVFRLLDDRGRLTGSLYAATLLLEGSRAARTLTVVLRDGYESRGGERTPFSAGERRITIPFVDPDPWVERMPELFPTEALVHANDDGLWDREALRAELNELLRRAAGSGWFRIHGIGGVQGTALRDVHLEDFGADGYRERRLFADAMRVRIGAEGVSLVLQGGAVHDRAGIHPFRDGSYRIYLPAADPDVWRAAHLPRADAPSEPGDATLSQAASAPAPPPASDG